MDVKHSGYREWFERERAASGTGVVYTARGDVNGALYKN